MDTNEPMKPPSLWIPEENPLIVACIGKLGEEASELSKACFRIVIQGMDGVDPDTGKSNRLALEEELADVAALSNLTISLFLLNLDDIKTRQGRKMSHKSQWFHMLREHLKGKGRS